MPMSECFTRSCFSCFSLWGRCPPGGVSCQACWPFSCPSCLPRPLTIIFTLHFVSCGHGLLSTSSHLINGLAEKCVRHQPALCGALFALFRFSWARGISFGTRKFHSFFLFFQLFSSKWRKRTQYTKHTEQILQGTVLSIEHKGW